MRQGSRSRHPVRFVRALFDTVLAVGVSVLVIGVGVNLLQPQTASLTRQNATVTSSGPTSEGYVPHGPTTPSTLPTAVPMSTVGQETGQPQGGEGAQSLQQEISVTVGPAAHPAGGATELHQTISASVLPGGPLQVSPDRVTVALRSDGPYLVGTLGPVVLTDPRGTLAGWTLRANLVGDPDDHGAPVLVVPEAPVALTGRQSEVSRARRQLVGDRGAVLMSARRYGGGGSFSVTVQVLEPATRSSPTSLTFVLSAS